MSFSEGDLFKLRAGKDGRYYATKSARPAVGDKVLESSGEKLTIHKSGTPTIGDKVLITQEKTHEKPAAIISGGPKICFHLTANNNYQVIAGEVVITPVTISIVVEQSIRWDKVLLEVDFGDDKPFKRYSYASTLFTYKNEELTYDELIEKYNETVAKSIFNPTSISVKYTYETLGKYTVTARLYYIENFKEGENYPYHTDHKPLTPDDARLIVDDGDLTTPVSISSMQFLTIEDLVQIVATEGELEREIILSDDLYEPDAPSYSFRHCFGASTSLLGFECQNAGRINTTTGWMRYTNLYMDPGKRNTFQGCLFASDFDMCLYRVCDESFWRDLRDQIIDYITAVRDETPLPDADGITSYKFTYYPDNPDFTAMVFQQPPQYQYAFAEYTIPIDFHETWGGHETTISTRYITPLACYLVETPDYQKKIIGGMTTLIGYYPWWPQVATLGDNVIQNVYESFISQNGAMSETVSQGTMIERRAAAIHEGSSDSRVEFIDSVENEFIACSGGKSRFKENASMTLIGYRESVGYPANVSSWFGVIGKSGSSFTHSRYDAGSDVYSPWPSPITIFGDVICHKAMNSLGHIYYLYYPDMTVVRVPETGRIIGSWQTCVENLEGDFAYTYNHWTEVREGEYEQRMGIWDLLTNELLYDEYDVSYGVATDFIRPPGCGYGGMYAVYDNTLYWITPDVKTPLICLNNLNIKFDSKYLFIECGPASSTGGFPYPDFHSTNYGQFVYYLPAGSASTPQPLFIGGVPVIAIAMTGTPGSYIVRSALGMIYKMSL